MFKTRDQMIQQLNSWGVEFDEGVKWADLQKLYFKEQKERKAAGPQPLQPTKNIGDITKKNGKFYFGVGHKNLRNGFIRSVLLLQGSHDPKVLSSFRTITNKAVEKDNLFPEGPINTTARSKDPLYICPYEDFPIETFHATWRSRMLSKATEIKHAIERVCVKTPDPETLEV